MHNETTAVKSNYKNANNFEKQLELTIRDMDALQHELKALISTAMEPAMEYDDYAPLKVAINAAEKNASSVNRLRYLKHTRLPKM